MNLTGALKTKPKAAITYDHTTGQIVPSGGATGIYQGAKAAAASMPADTSYKQDKFNYDPNSDPVYQAALARAKTNAQSAGGDAMALMNKRGILDSDVTRDRVAGIAQDAVSGVETDLMPQLMTQAYQRFQDSDNRKYQMSRDSVVDQQNAENTAINKGNMLGYYLDPKDKDYINQVIQAKDDYAKASTSEAKAEASQRAEAARNYLLADGVDPSLFGSDVTAAQAAQNIGKAGAQTLQAKGQKFDQELQTKQYNLQDKQVMAELTGKLPDGTPTTAEQQRLLGNAWTESSQLGYVTSGLSKLTGIPQGTKTMQAVDMYFNQGIAKQNVAISQQNANTSAYSAANSAANQATDNAMTAGNNSYSRLLDIWQATGSAPAGLEQYGVKQGAPYGQQEQPKVTQNQVESSYVSNLGRMTQDQLVDFFSSEKSSIVNDLGIDGYNRLYSQYFDKDGYPRK